jgi:CubicO group peptidase (beta-lactamase class C family)
MTEPSPGNKGYGAQTWLNWPQPDGPRLWEGLPAATFSMNGHLGQFVVVDRSRAVTVVRLGKTDEGKHAPVRTGIVKIIQLFAKEGAK